MAVYQPKGSSTGASSAAFEVRTTNPDDVESVKAELAREQERLRKLWDAFKSQEDELTRLRGTSGSAAATSTAALQSTAADRAADRAADQRTIDALRREVELLTGDLRRAGDAQRGLEETNSALREQVRTLEQAERRAEDRQRDLDQERERLAKLYIVYEEVEAERSRLEQHLKEWDSWYHGVSPHLAEICRSIGGAPHS